MKSGARGEANPTTPAARAASTDGRSACAGETGAPVADAERAGPPAPSSQDPAEGGARRPAARLTGLLMGTPREILARISDRDPLQVRKLVAAHLASEALLCDSDRVHLRALVQVSRLARRATGGLPAMLEESVKRATADALRRSDAPGSGPDAFETLAAPLGIAAHAARLASSAFNRCAIDDRRACLALLVEGRSIDDVARGERVSASEIARRARRALESALDVLEDPRALPARAMPAPAAKEAR